MKWGKHWLKMMNNDQNKRDSKRNQSSKDPFLLIKNLVRYNTTDTGAINYIGTTNFEEMAVPASKISCFGKSNNGYFVDIFNSRYFIDKIEYDKIQTWLSSLYMVFK